MEKTQSPQTNWSFLRTILVFTVGAPLIGLVIFLLLLGVWTNTIGESCGAGCTDKDAEISSILIFVLVGMTALFKAPMAMIPAAAIGLFGSVLRRFGVGRVGYCALCAAAGVGASWGAGAFLGADQFPFLLLPAGGFAALACALLTWRR